ncbi:MAG TPA: hypothetical protein VNZ53_16240 [Steroidobacteraceae bacterium]|nr:hypothetical protein [Steroidobacteraceae bacterium]
MLLHLPIAILATFSPIAVSDNVPKFDIVRQCRFEGGSTVEFDRCSQDEAEALEQLEANWAQFTGVDKSTCLTVATIGGFASYVELLTCLEMAREANNTDRNLRNPKRTGPMRPAGPGVTVGVGPGPTSPGQMPGRGSR